MTVQDQVPFPGSYAEGDVQFLLKRVEFQSTDVEEKERHIQSGTRHYSEMITQESPPAPEYRDLFSQAMDRGAQRMGRETAQLAKAISARIESPITLVSLVRAGVPLGVILKRALHKLGRDVDHFGISIIRDRGLDAAAMAHILARRPQDGIVFIDGWTGKGAIATELEKQSGTYGEMTGRLAVLADPCGRAWLAASGEDWLIPSGILGATVSGLVSRSILNDTVVGPGDFHACVEWSQLQDHDVSRTFVDTIWQECQKTLMTATLAEWSPQHRDRHKALAHRAVDWVATRYGVTNFNRIKPGIAEATRAILRRSPERVFLTSENDPDLAALLHLVQEMKIPFHIVPEKIAPYRAITLIKKVFEDA